jgi:hypothetical protein
VDPPSHVGIVDAFHRLQRAAPDPGGELGVTHSARIPAPAHEVVEKVSCKPDASGRAQLHEEWNAWAEAGHGDREGVVDLARTEDERPPAPPAADLVRDDLVS